MHRDNPASLIEATFRRIETERWAGMSMLNPQLAVAAIGFAQKTDDWRGVLLTPWGINLLLLPAVPDWPVPATHERAFREYPAGTFAFLPNHEEGLGDYLACPLINDMSHFKDQETAVMTAQACLIALDLAPPQPAPEQADPAAPASPGRRSFFIRPAK